MDHFNDRNAHQIAGGSRAYDTEEQEEPNQMEGIEEQQEETQMDEEEEQVHCDICHRICKNDENWMYGTTYQKSIRIGTVTVHYYCLVSKKTRSNSFSIITNTKKYFFFLVVRDWFGTERKGQRRNSRIFASSHKRSHWSANARRHSIIHAPPPENADSNFVDNFWHTAITITAFTETSATKTSTNV